MVALSLSQLMKFGRVNEGLTLQNDFNLRSWTLMFDYQIEIWVIEMFYVQILAGWL